MYATDSATMDVKVQPLSIVKDIKKERLCMYTPSIVAASLTFIEADWCNIMPKTFLPHADLAFAGAVRPSASLFTEVKTISYYALQNEISLLTYPPLNIDHRHLS